MRNIDELTAKLKASAPYEMKFSRLWERFEEACHGNAEHMRDILELTLDALETAERRIAKSDRDVLALTEALEAADALNKHLELAIRKAEGCSEALRRKTEAAEKRIAELEARHTKLRESMAAIHNTIRLDGVGTSLSGLLSASKRAWEESAPDAGINLTVEG